jgi:hypothetical protein
MTVGKISTVCWIVFVLMSLAFLPLGIGIVILPPIHALPIVVRVVLAVLVVGCLWWGPFVYGMYLTTTVIKNGDQRLFKRGTSGTAVVLSAKETNMVVQSGEFDWQAPRVYRYRLRVSIPGKDPYETNCSICFAGIREGSTVDVAVSPRNRMRVAIRVGQGRKDGVGVPGPRPGGGAEARIFPNGTVGITPDPIPAGPGHLLSAAAERIDALIKLSRLHSQGVLTDAEFAAEKARILSQ